MSTPKRPNQDRSKNGPSPLLVVGGVVLAVIAVAVIVILLGGSDDDSDADGTPPASTVEVAPVDPSLQDPRLPEELRNEARPLDVEGTALAPFADGVADPALGQVPPTLIGEDATGFVHTISPDIDGPVLLVFLAHWCAACNQELPMLVELGQQGLLPDDLQVYGVLTAMDPSRPGFPPSSWITGAGWPFDYVADEPDFDRGAAWKAADAYGLTAYPMNVVIDDGVVVDRWTGASPPDAYVARVVAAIS